MYSRSQYLLKDWRRFGQLKNKRTLFFLLYDFNTKTAKQNNMWRNDNGDISAELWRILFYNENTYEISKQQFILIICSFLAI